MTGSHDDDQQQPADREPSLAVTIAQTIGEVLAQTASTEDSQEVRAITDAMIRLLIGVPVRSDGQLTVKSLALEAGLKRNKLTHKHTDLKDLFYALVRSQGALPRAADGLQRRNTVLVEQLRKSRAARAALEAQVKQLARVVHVLEVENHQLRQAAAAGGGVVRLFPGART